MFYTTNKPRHSTYLCTPSGNKIKAEALISLGLSVLHLFYYPLKMSCKKTFVFLQPLYLYYLNHAHIIFMKYDFRVKSAVLIAVRSFLRHNSTFSVYFFNLFFIGNTG